MAEKLWTELKERNRVKVVGDSRITRGGLHGLGGRKGYLLVLRPDEVLPKFLNSCLSLSSILTIEMERAHTHLILGIF